MTPSEMYTNILSPALDHLEALGGPGRSRKADVLLLAISGQEADWRHRVQRSRRANGTFFDGPARGLWQFERGGGVAGVLMHSATKRLAARVCEAHGVLATSHTVHEALATDDTLAACFARLLLYTDPLPLPDTQGGGWSCYARNWRPGAPHPDKWPHCWTEAAKAVS